LLEQASGLVEIVTDRPLDRLGSERSDRVDGPDFLGSLVGSGWPELVALGKAMSILLPDRPIARSFARSAASRCRRVRRRGPPRWT